MENDDFENEIWLPIADYPNYQISNYGRVKSLERTIFMPNGGIKYIPEKLLTPCQSSNGYLKVNLYDNGKHKLISIHRLVANAFIPNHNNFPQINHKDENKENNHIDNLEWCNCVYNINFGTRNKKSSISQINHPKKSKQVNQYSLDGKTLIKIWQSTHEIERQLGYSHQNISNCCKGKYKSAYGSIWRFNEN